jgi:glutamate formiminotransferase
MQACAIYVSSGAAAVAAQIASLAARSPSVAVVDTFCDASYARSSIKIVGHPLHLLPAALAAARLALATIDLSTQPHPAPHPRCGAVDMVSFMPLSNQAAACIADDINICDKLAWDFGASLGSLGCPVLMFGQAARRSLRDTRRSTSFFSSVAAAQSPDVFSTLRSDFGPDKICQKSGIAIVGSQPYVTNFNIQVSGSSLDACKRTAAKLRSEMRVQVMALPHAGDRIEIGCNLQATETEPCQSTESVLKFVTDLLPEEACVLRAYVVGLTPEDALRRAKAGATIP